jgi:hypothetical protein
VPAYSIPLHRGACQTCGERNACFTGRTSKTQVCGDCMTVEVDAIEQAARDEAQARWERQTRRRKAVAA